MITTPLLTLAHTCAEWTAGIAGHCAARVRLLDDVTLRVHAGELLLVQGPESLGRALLLSVLAGASSPDRHRYVRGVRALAPRVRIRRAAVHAMAVQAIVRGWQDAESPREAGTEERHRRPPTLYLLRASRSAAPTRFETREWRRWARRARERHDGIVIVGPASQPTLPDAIPLVRSAAREPAVRYQVRRDRVLHRDAGGVRLLEIRAGRLYEVAGADNDTPVRR
ncbi:MAG: hypothetical protein P3C10_00665 [Gemmatimonadota bacterium]|nr:hypothetical protein [Gemmatimonadota bacterium]